jgi:biotin-dependent carboxylase-like uncharacterized protein
MDAFTVERAGMLTTVQDLGRWGYQSRGVPVSGALDWVSHRLANRLLGNNAGSATLEVTLIGPQLRFESDTAFAVAGAEFKLTLDGKPVERDQSVDARAGSVLAFGERVNGARAYIAVSGGVDTPPVLGSRSTHVLTRMGGHEGRALRAGDAIQSGQKQPNRAKALFHLYRWHRPSGLSRLRVIPVDERLAEYLMRQRFQISPQSDRMGFRLEPKITPGAIFGATSGQLISASVPTGAIQVTPSGQPILLMNDHATTGGYAIAAVVIAADLPRAGQLAPGDWVEFDACSMEAADAALRDWEAVLADE